MPKVNSLTERLAIFKRSRVAFLKQFGRDEDGSIIVLTLLLLFGMLIVGGMAVDFMRYESRRAQLQSVSDRAVLAAADLDQTEDAAAVVTDFFTKAGYGDAIVGTPTIISSQGNRTVDVRSEIDVNTFYLRLVGIDTLDAPARSRAVEGTGNVEISLILDISWSMNSTVSSADPEVDGKRRIELLRSAAQGFIDDLKLDSPDYTNQISVNLVPYSQQVRLGDELFNALNVANKTVAELDDDGSIKLQHTNQAQCIDFEPFLTPGWSAPIPMGEYGQLGFDTDRTYHQVEDARHYNGYDPVCPSEDFESIITLSQDPVQLKEAIGLIDASLNTSIHVGMKWGLSLLDPSMRELLGGLPSTDAAFAGIRPADYDNESNTVKYVILMTDGQNASGPRIRPEYYTSAAHRIALATDTVSAFASSIEQTTGSVRYTPNNATQQDIWLQEMCRLARTEMTVYTIAMGSTSHGTSQMLECAGNSSRAFSTSFSGTGGEKGIDEIFATIAEQITALRLNL